MTASEELARLVERMVREEVERQLAQLRDTVAAEQLSSPDPWLTLEEAATYSGRHPRLIRKACETGELAAIRRATDDRWSVRSSAVDGWLAAGRQRVRGGNFLSVVDAAAYLGVAVSTLRDWRVDGKGPDAIKIGRLVKYRREDLDRFVVEQAK